MYVCFLFPFPIFLLTFHPFSLSVDLFHSISISLSIHLLVSPLYLPLPPSSLPLLKS